MNHNWVSKEFSVPGINREQCSICGVDTYLSNYPHHVKIRYLWIRPMGEIQPVCPETCEETFFLVKGRMASGNDIQATIMYQDRYIMSKLNFDKDVIYAPKNKDEALALALRCYTDVSSHSTRQVTFQNLDYFEKIEVVRPQISLFR